MFSRIARTATRFATSTHAVPASVANIRPTSTAAAPSVDLTAGKVFPALPPFPTSEQITKAMDEYVASSALPAEQTFFGGLKQIINEYGWYPFLGLGSAILLSKEIFQINTEFVVMADFSILTFIGYVLAADKVNAVVTEERAAIVDEVNSVFKAEQELYKAQLDSCQAVINMPKVIAEANAAFIEANEAVAKARDLTARANFRDSIVARLQAIKASEEEAANQQREAVKAKALADVMELIKSAKVRASVLDEAIALVGATEDKTGEFTALSKAIEDSLKKLQA